ncbi:MAG: ABC transporter permease [Oscillospiraceae bacterium]
MWKYVLKRIGYALLTVFVLASLTFFMMRMLPGDPFIGAKAIPEKTKQMMNEKYGLDKPVIEQYFIFMGNVAKGDLGTSIISNRPVSQIIAESFPYSCDLGVRALIFALIMGVLLGIVASVKRGTLADTGSMLIAIVGVSVPSFIIGSLLQYFICLKFPMWFGWPRIFPVMGWKTEMSKILPAFALSFSAMATISRLMRTSMLDVLSSDYIKTAKAKGLSERTIVWRHAVRNAIMPVVTVLGPLTAALLTGAFVVEKIFAIPGLGKFFVQSITSLDYPVISGTVIFYGAFLVLANLVVDLLYGFIDPRVKMTGGKE